MTTERSSMVSETQSDGTAISPLLESLPDPVRNALARPGIDAAQFNPVVTAFGTLPTEGQITLANGLIVARDQYIVDRAWACDGEIRTGATRKQLGKIGVAAQRLLKLLHRNGSGHQPLNPHPAVTLALPQLFQCRSDRNWDHGGLGQFCAMLGDLAKVGAKADKVFPSEFAGKHGGPRRKDPTAATALVERLIGVYEFLREQYPESGPTPACDAPLREFVRAGLAFVVSAPPEIIDSDGNRLRSPELRLLEPALPKRTTDSAIHAVYDRLHGSS